MHTENNGHDCKTVLEDGKSKLLGEALQLHRIELYAYGMAMGFVVAVVAKT